MHRVVTTELDRADDRCNFVGGDDVLLMRPASPGNLLPDLGALIGDLAQESGDEDLGLLMQDGLLDDFFSSDSPLPSMEPSMSSPSVLDQGSSGMTETQGRLEGLMDIVVHSRQSSNESSNLPAAGAAGQSIAMQSHQLGARARSASESSERQSGQKAPTAAALVSELQRIIMQHGAITARTAAVRANSRPSPAELPVPQDQQASFASVTTAVERIVPSAREAGEATTTPAFGWQQRPGMPAANPKLPPARRPSRNRVAIRNGMFSELEKVLGEKKEQCQVLERHNDILRRKQRMMDLCIQVKGSDYILLLYQTPMNIVLMFMAYSYFLYDSVSRGCDPGVDKDHSGFKGPHGAPAPLVARAPYPRGFVTGGNTHLEHRQDQRLFHVSVDSNSSVKH